MADKKTAPAGNEAKKPIWSRPGGEDLALREAGAGAEAGERETPAGTLWKTPDPRIKDLGPDENTGKENRKKNKTLG